MEKVDLLAQALNLTFFGMGFVFLFLTLLVFVTKLMSFVAQKTHKQTATVDIHHNTMEDELDEETKFVIEEAIKIHRGA